jgi:2-alkyl-3-oxoalkanoate reductase
MAQKIAVLGASGFVGSTVCEALLRRGDTEVVACVHSFARAARLARYPVTFKPLDALSVEMTAEGIAGSDVVVNCTMPPGYLMAKAARNIVRACRRARVPRVVHVSSAAIYGSRFPTDGADTPRPTDVYGEAKLRQDEVFLSASRRGPAAICISPANIYGPYSAFILGVMSQLRAGALGLVDGGTNPTNNVHVDNVAAAILTAAASDRGWGARYAVNDPEPTTWRTFLQDMQALLGIAEPLPQLSSDVVRAAQPEVVRRRLRENFTALLSGEFRKGLMAIPVFDWGIGALYRQFSRMDPAFQARMRARLEKPDRVAPLREGVDPGARFNQEQLRSGFLSPARLMDVLGYRPVVDYARGMASVRHWLEFNNLIDHADAAGGARGAVL